MFHEKHSLGCLITVHTVLKIFILCLRIVVYAEFFFMFHEKHFFVVLSSVVFGNLFSKSYVESFLNDMYFKLSNGSLFFIILNDECSSFKTFRFFLLKMNFSFDSENLEKIN